MRVGNGQTNATAIAAHLDKVARQVRDVLWQMEDPIKGVLKDPDLEEELVFFLKKLYTQAMIALDHLGLAGSRADLARAWDGFVKSGLKKVSFYPGANAVGSEVYEYLDAVIDGLRATDDPAATENRDKQSELINLEKLLNRTAYLLQKRSVVPSKEKQIQDVMDDYLEAIYGADYHHHFSIPGAVKNFRPDAGIRSLGAVIEFKFAADSQGLKTATSGLFEDSAVYKASKDWKKYYSVVYMTGAHGTKEQLLAAFKQAGMIDWMPILVTGAGPRPSKLARNTRGTRARTGAARQ